MVESGSARWVVEALDRHRMKRWTRTWIRYLFAALGIFMAEAVRAGLARAGLEISPFITYYPAVVVVALFAGNGPALMTVVAAVLLANRVMPPVGRFHIPAPADAAALTIFGLLSLLLIGLAERARRTQRREREQRSTFERTDAELRQTRRQFLIAQELSLDPFTILRAVRDDDGRIIDFSWEYANPAALKVLGRADLIGKSLLETFPHQRQSPDLFPRYRRIAERGDGDTVEVHYDHDGISGWYRNMCVKLDDGVAVAFSDITARRHEQFAHRMLAEVGAVLAASLESQQTLSNLADTLASGALADLVVLDMIGGDGVLRKAAVGHADRSRLPMVRTLMDFIPGEHRAAAATRVAVTRKPLLLSKITDETWLKFDYSSGAAEVLNRLKLRSGVIMPLIARDRVLGTIAFFCDDRDEYPAPDVILCRQIADRSALAIDNSLLYEQACAANQAKDQFLAVLSHELRTPLTPILAAAQLLTGESALSGDGREAVALIRRNAELEARLIDDLLDVTRITRGKLELHLQTVDAHDLIDQAIEMVRPDLTARSIQLEMDLGGEHRVIEADPARFQQVMWNLMKNAVKFTPSDGLIRVRSWNEPGESSLHIEVSDNGVGIDASFLPRIFNAFEQGERKVNRQFGGLGLGLAITKSLIEAHQGTIRARSTGPGRGAAFIITWPTVATTPGNSPIASAPRPAPARPLEILLVEDHADTARLTARLLEVDGHRVRIAASVAAAMDEAMARPFDLLISDLGLPDGTGIDLMRRLSALRPVRGIALSGFGMDEDIERSRESGFAMHLTKPVDMDTIRAAIAQVAGQG